MNPNTWQRSKSKPSDDWRIAKEMRQSSLDFMELIDDTTKKTVLDVSERRVDPDITLETDGNPIYGACAKAMGASNRVTLSSDETAHEVLEWVDTLISNCKKFIDGTYHGRQEHKQLYLEEFVYRFNRRGMGSSLVDRLLNKIGRAHV